MTVAAPLQRRRRLAAAAVLAACLATAAACGRSPEASDAPGYDASATTIDTTPFDLAGPSSRSGSTTIPSGAFDPAEPTVTEPAPEDATTTTQPPFFLPSNVTSICGATRSLASLFPRDPIPDAQVAGTLAQLRVNLAAYEQLAPATVRADFTAVRTMVEELDRLFQEGGQTTSYPPLQAVLQQLTQAQPPYREVISAIARIRIQEEQICGEAG